MPPLVYNTNERRRVWATLLFSFLLHLLVLLGYIRWTAEQTPEVPLAVHFQPEAEKPVLRFAPTAPRGLPQVQMQRLASEPEPQEVQVEVADGVELEALAMEEGVLHLPVDRPLGTRTDGFRVGADSLVSFADLQRALIEGRADALKGYARPWLADADTTDAESRNRRQAEAIVDRAIGAMGGLERMSKLKNKKVTPVDLNRTTGKRGEGIPKYYMEGRKFREGSSETIMRGFDGYKGWGYRYGVPIGVSDRGLQQQAERWDFLAQFKGEGIGKIAELLTMRLADQIGQVRVTFCPAICTVRPGH